MVASIIGKNTALVRRTTSPGFLGPVRWAGSLITHRSLCNDVMLNPTPYVSASTSEDFKISLCFVPLLAGGIALRFCANDFT